MNYAILSLTVLSCLFSALILPAQAQQPAGFGAKRRYVAQRFDVQRFETPQVISNLPRYPGPSKLLSSVKMPHTPGGATYNERYLTTDSPERVLLYYKSALSMGGWQSEQSGWSVNGRDAQKNFCRVHVLAQDLSTELPSTRFIIEYKEHSH